ncbi:MAG: HEAT repeat domain-containing protein, partial [Anaerolineae bacterium]|nr:HEAT repeat domain-containing protein [Anaerolineae bacterium]
MSESILSQQLHNPDPRQRFKAIKQAARNKEMALLDVIAELAQNDPDDQVRMVAQKARAYLTGGLESGGAPESAGTPVYRPLDKKTESLAQSELDAALSYHLAGQREKALKSLGKVLQMAPIKATDQYFISVMNEITGRETEESLQMLRDASRMKQLSVTEKQLAQEKELDKHLQNVEKSTWVSAGMDLVIYTMIVVIGTLLIVVAIGQSAAGTLSGYAAAREAFNAAVAAGEKNIMPVEPLPV